MELSFNGSLTFLSESNENSVAEMKTEMVNQMVEGRAW